MEAVQLLAVYAILGIVFCLLPVGRHCNARDSAKPSKALDCLAPEPQRRPGGRRRAFAAW